jgi:hypothetical protein
MRPSPRSRATRQRNQTLTGTRLPNRRAKLPENTQFVSALGKKLRQFGNYGGHPARRRALTRDRLPACGAAAGPWGRCRPVGPLARVEVEVAILLDQANPARLPEGLGLRGGLR